MAADDALAGGPIEPGKPLPPGRHGLPRETITESQRWRIINSMISAVSERGFSETRVVDVVEPAHVSRQTFYELFDDLEDCFLVSYDYVSGRLVETTTAAYNDHSDGHWSKRINAAMAALLELLASWPEGARFAIVDVLAVGPNALVRRDAFLRRLTELVDAGRSYSQDEVPGITAVGIVGGIEEMLYSEVIHGATAQLPTRLPDIVYWVTQPFLGNDAAAAERERARDSLRASG